jgi:hypothetical protein
MPTTARRPDAAPRPALPVARTRGALRARPTGDRPPGRRSPGARAVVGVLAAGAVLLLSGCGLRWETEPPTEPAPDAAEDARRTAVDDALALGEAAQVAAAGAAEPVSGVLALVVDAASTQVEALGGVYDSGLPEPEPDADAPSPSASATTAPPATPAVVLEQLGAAASAARADALAAEDPGLARLLASVAASRAQLTDRLAAALGVEAPAVDAAPGPDWPSGGAADGSGSGDGSATSPAATPSDAATPTGPPDPGAGGSDVPGGDLDRADLVALALAEDQAGFGFEVAAARLSDDARSLARDAAARHRAAAGAWATLAGVAGTADDPRRVSYELDGDVSSAEAVRAFCAGLLSDLAAVHADAVLATDAGTADRTTAVDGLRTAAVETLPWGGTPTPLPGLPDAPAPSPTAAAG